MKEKKTAKEERIDRLIRSLKIRGGRITHVHESKTKYNRKRDKKNHEKI